MTITVSSGVAKNDLTISSGDPLIVLSGGEVEDSSILSGGLATFSAGAVGSGLTVASGGALLGPGDLTGFINVSGTISEAAIVSDGYLSLDGGAATGVTVTQDGDLVTEGGKVVDTILTGGSYLLIYGPTVDSGTVVGSGCEEYLAGNGVATGDTAESGGLLFLQGSASGETVLSGGTLKFQGDLTSDLTLGAAASTTVAAGATISSGGILELNSGTVRSGVTVSLAGTSAFGLTVDSGGVLLGAGYVDGFGTIAGAISGVTFESGLGAEIVSGGSAVGLTIWFSEIRVDAGASATGTMVSRGGIEVVSSGGAASGTQVFDAGIAYVQSSGTTTGTVVSDGGKEVVSSGGIASGTTVLNGGRGYVLSTGVTSGTTLGGGREAISAGGSAVGATAASGGVLYVLGSGTAKGTVVSSGGYELISSGGVADATDVLSGGAEDVYSGGLDDHGVVSSGAAEAIYAGGAAGDLALLSGGRLIDNGEVRFDGAGTLDGTLSGTGAIVESGTGTLVLSGDGLKFAGLAAISGGVIDLAAKDALGTGGVVFAEPPSGLAVLQIDAADAPKAGGTFANTLSNFNGAGEEIDLTSIAFVAGASAAFSGPTLVLTDGGKTYSFTIAGGTAAGYVVTSDGHGGTLIDPSAALFAQTAAAFAPADAARTALVTSTSPVGQTPFLHAAAHT